MQTDQEDKDRIYWIVLGGAWAHEEERLVRLWHRHAIEYLEETGAEVCVLPYKGKDLEECSAQAIALFAEKFASKKCVYLYGYSMGSWILRVLAARFPNVQGTVIVEGTTMNGVLFLGLLKAV